MEKLICNHMRREFPHRLSYNRFVERQAKVRLHLLLFLQTCALGKCLEYHSSIPPPHTHTCVMSHKEGWQTQDDGGWMTKGKCTMGWFYGFKLHIVINDRGEIIQWALTPGNAYNGGLLKSNDFTQRLFGKIFADRGYISQELFETILLTTCMAYCI